MSAPQLPPHIVDPQGRVWPLKGPPGSPAHPIPGVKMQPPPRRAVDAGVGGQARQEHSTRGVRQQRGTVRRRRQYRPHTVAFVDLRTGEGASDAGDVFRVRKPYSLACVLRALPADVERVFLLGPRPGGDVEGFDRWAGAVPKDWAPRGHYLENLTLPVLRYEWTGETGPRRKLEMHRAQTWFGDEAATAATARDALGRVGQLVGAAFDGAPLLGTPGTTGRELFVRSIPFDTCYPVLDDDTAQLVRSTTGQGRVELFAHDELAELVELDGRLMYGALCWGLGSGLESHRVARGDELTDELRTDRRALYHPARYRVRFTVPHGWQGPGLFGVKNDGAGWSYPRRPGQRGDTWVDGAELFVALREGWPVEVVEALRFNAPGTRSGPLDVWAKKLVALWNDVYPDAEPWRGGSREVARLTRAALRNVLLHGLGAFVGRPRLTTKSLPIDQGADVPANAYGLRVLGDAIVWGERVASAEPTLCHPEWAAAVWGRCRARMLSGPANTGALHVPFSTLVAIRTDALYLTCDPGWTDDGKPGRLRVKNRRIGPFPAPANGAELLRLRDGT